MVDNYKPLKQSQIELITEENTPLSITSKTKLEIMEYKYPNCEKNLKAIILHTNKRHFKFKILNPNQQNIFSRFTSNVWDNQGNKFLPVLYNYIKINKKNYISNILADKFHPIELILDQKNIEIEIKNKIKHLNNNNNIKD